MACCNKFICNGSCLVTSATRLWLELNGSIPCIVDSYVEVFLFRSEWKAGEHVVKDPESVAAMVEM